jgi:hypothetical protein
VSASLSENVVEQATATRTIEVRRAAVVARRSCARGGTPEAARGNALNQAYADALAAARARAQALAQRELANLAPGQLAALQSSARKELEARAQAAAASVRRTLVRQALAQVNARARALSR